MSDPVGRGKQTPEEALRGLEEWAVAEGLGDEALTLLGLAIAEVGAGAPNLLLRKAILRAKWADSVDDFVYLEPSSPSSRFADQGSMLVGESDTSDDAAAVPGNAQADSEWIDLESHAPQGERRATRIYDGDGNWRRPTPEEEAGFQRGDRWNKVRVEMASLARRLSTDGHGRADDLLLQARAIRAELDEAAGNRLLSACENLASASRKWRAPLSAAQEEELVSEAESSIEDALAAVSGVVLARGNVRDESGGLTLPPGMGGYAQELWRRLKQAAISKELVGHADAPQIAREELRRAGYLRIDKGGSGTRNVYVLVRPPDPP